MLEVQSNLPHNLVEKFCKACRLVIPAVAAWTDREAADPGAIILLMEVPLNCTAHTQHSMCLTLQSACCNSSTTGDHMTRRQNQTCTQVLA